MYQYTVNELLTMLWYDIMLPRAMRKAVFSYRLWLLTK